MLLMPGVGERIEKDVKTGDSARVFGRTCEFPVDADWMARVEEKGQSSLKDHGVLQLSPKS